MSNSKATCVVTVVNPQGLHARPADMLVKLANQYKSKIEIIRSRERVDCKSILALLTLAAVQGTELSVEADGDDAEAAIAAVTELFAQGFAENE